MARILLIALSLLPAVTCAQNDSARNGLPTLNDTAELQAPLAEDAVIHRTQPVFRVGSDYGSLDDAPPSELVQDRDHIENPDSRRQYQASGVDSDTQLIDTLAREIKNLTSREGTGSSVKLVLLLGALSLAPALLLMTTSYVRIIVVLSLLRQAFGAQQLPPNQVLTALSLFLTLLVMKPVWTEIKTEAIDPYASAEQISWEEAWQRGISPVKRFMIRQIEITHNTKSIEVFYHHLPEATRSQSPLKIEDVPITVLLPAFIVSELKVAFLLGFQIFLPFLVLDFVVSTVTVSMGMFMLPPTVVSFPLKLILFVMVDGWSLVVGMLLQSFGTFT